MPSFIHLILHGHVTLQREEMRRMEARCQEAEMHNGMLSQRLARSDALRMDQLKAIEQLRHEIMDMQARLRPLSSHSASDPIMTRVVYVLPCL